MDNKILTLVFLSIASCSSNRELKKVKCDVFKVNQPTLKMPKGYNLKIFNGGSEWTEYQFRYNDSSIIYLSDDLSGHINNENIKASNRLGVLFEATKLKPDTLTLMGIDKDGRYWKHVVIGKFYSIGYLRVTQEKKSLYDRSLETLKLKSTTP